MSTLRGTARAIAAAFALSMIISPATAAMQIAYFDQLTASSNIAPELSANDSIYFDTVVTSAVGALSQSATFTVGAGVTGFTGQAAWMISTAAGPGPRLIGVNIDLINTTTNTVVASDVFGGVLAGFAHSSFSGAITPGNYQLIATGTGVRDALMDIALSFTGTPPAVAAASTGGIPAQGPSTSTPQVFFNTLADSRTITQPIGAGETLLVDTLVPSNTGSLSQTVTFTLGAGVDGLTGSANWMISTSAGPGPRLIGLNIDILDASNTLVVSDAFAGVLDGVADSTFTQSLNPGTYHMVITGTGIRESSLNIGLSFTGTAVESVPEVPTFVLLATSLLGLAAARRKRVAVVRTA